jgi:hypothetical protein
MFFLPLRLIIVLLVRECCCYTVLNVSSDALNGTYKTGDVIDIYRLLSGPLI